MASTYSPNLRLELIGTGEQQGTWGSTTNTNLGTLLEEAIGGYVSITVSNSGDTTLTTNNGSADQSRNMVINLTGTISAARNVICPAIEKIYVVKNATTGGFAVTFKVSGQTGVSIPNGSTYFLYVDGTDARMITGSLANQLASSVSITGGTITGITDLAIADGGTGASDAANARTNLGLGTGDSPQFTAVNIGNASDTTITRSSAGVIAVEGKPVVTTTGAQTVEFAAGSSTTPSITTTGDTNTGIFFPAADTIAFTEGGSESMRIDSSGNVGIGTSALATDRTKLEIRGPNRPVNDWCNVAIYTTNAAATNLGGSIALGGQNGQGVNPTFTFGSIAGRYEGTGYAGYLQFSTVVGGSGAVVERLRITSTGNVGIGTTTPDALLSVNGIGSFGAGAAATPSISTTGDLNTGMWFPAADTLAWSTGGTERMRLDTNGNVIVNTAAVATNATNGFLYVPSCAGTPTGTPTTYTGRVPIVVDTTNNKLYFYSGGQWRDAGP